MQRIPWWHGKPVGPAPRQSGLAVVVAIAALVFVVIGVVVAVMGGTRYVLGVAMLVVVVALPAAASLHRRQR